MLFVLLNVCLLIMPSRVSLFDIIQDIQRLRIVSAIVDVVNSNGLDSAEYKKVFVMQKSSMEMDPPVSLTFPPHLLWAQAKFDIEGTDLFDRWVARTGQDALRKAGVGDIPSEHMHLWSERVAMAFSSDDHTSKLKEMLSLK